MGCSKKAIHDDQCEWDDLKKEANILGQRWEVYSNEASYATEGYSKHRFTGRRLVLFVRQQLEMDKLKEKHTAEIKELAKLEKLEKKYA